MKMLCMISYILVLSLTEDLVHGKCGGKSCSGKGDMCLKGPYIRGRCAKSCVKELCIKNFESDPCSNNLCPKGDTCRAPWWARGGSSNKKSVVAETTCTSRNCAYSCKRDEVCVKSAENDYLCVPREIKYMLDLSPKDLEMKATFEATEKGVFVKCSRYDIHPCDPYIMPLEWRCCQDWKSFKKSFFQHESFWHHGTYCNLDLGGCVSQRMELGKLRWTLPVLDDKQGHRKCDEYCPCCDIREAEKHVEKKGTPKASRGFTKRFVSKHKKYYG